MVAPSSEGDGPVEVREIGCPRLLGDLKEVDMVGALLLGLSAV
jgi:hypothetical protein